MPSAHADNDRKRRRDTISAGMLQALSHANIQFFSSWRKNVELNAQILSGTSTLQSAVHSSSVTKVGVIHCGNWWCHLFHLK